MMRSKPIALWAVPRSVSTAFERIFVEREDFEVFHEPFAISYYFSEERRSDRYLDEESKEQHRPENVLSELLIDNGKPVFFKDMAYHTTGFMDRDFVENFRNTFLIREPKQTLSSFYKMWPDFTFEEAGYEQLHRLYSYAAEIGQEPIVVDAADFSANTERAIEAYCAELNIPLTRTLSIGNRGRFRSGKHGTSGTPMPRTARGSKNSPRKTRRCRISCRRLTSAVYHTMKISTKSDFNRSLCPERIARTGAIGCDEMKTL